MSGFICKKPISLSGTQYVPGDSIPAEAILPSRVLALKRSNHIVEMGAEAAQNASASETPKLPQNGDFDNYPIEIPISTEEGLLTATVGSKSVVKAFTILQLSEADAKKEIDITEDDDALMLMNAVERRKSVLKALNDRHAQLTKVGDADGEDV